MFDHRVRRTMTCLFIVTVSCSCPVTAIPQEPTSATACTVAITSPAEGNSVGPDGDVSGTATIPSSKYLWILAHRKGLQGWWPQGGGPALVDQGKWQVSVTYGLPRDIGRDFEIVAVAVEAEANATLKAWVQRADSTGTYPPTALPASPASCAIARTTVRKTE